MEIKEGGRNKGGKGKEDRIDRIKRERGPHCHRVPKAPSHLKKALTVTLPFSTAKQMYFQFWLQMRIGRFSKGYDCDFGFNQLKRRPLMLPLRVTFIFNMAATKSEVLLNVQYFYVQLLVDVKQYQHTLHRLGYSRNCRYSHCNFDNTTCLWVYLLCLRYSMT
jgi:hypothetical protein